MKIVLECNIEPYLFEEGVFERAGELKPEEIEQLNRIRALTAEARELYEIPERYAHRQP